MGTDGVVDVGFHVGQRILIVFHATCSLAACLAVRLPNCGANTAVPASAPVPASALVSPSSTTHRPGWPRGLDLLALAAGKLVSVLANR